MPGKITGFERQEELPEKVLLLYRAVGELIEEGADVSKTCVLAITKRAGIGKGTAYDYFETKEDMIACALVFYAKRAAEKISSALLKQKDFEQQLLFMMDEIEKEGKKQHCFIRFVHVMTDNNEISRLVREKLTRDSQGAYLPSALLGDVIQRARQRGEIKAEVSDDYLIFSVFARLMTYMVCVCTRDCFKVEPERIRLLVFEGILQEFSGKSFERER